MERANQQNNVADRQKGRKVRRAGQVVQHKIAPAEKQVSKCSKTDRPYVLNDAGLELAKGNAQQRAQHKAQAARGRNVHQRSRSLALKWNEKKKKKNRSQKRKEEN